MTDAPSWSDEPVTRVSQDAFGRAPFATLVAQSIDAIPLGSASTVFGLVGTWGSGKSSVAGMVADSLPGSWTVQAFTPWAASGVAELQLEFVAALDAALGGQLKEQDETRQALKKYVDWVRPLIHAGPGALRVVAQAAENATDAALARKPWSVEFEALARGLQSMNKRVLIVCDDIDRLDATELLQFLKVVRLLGRFPNVHYLIAYDADTVEDLLAAEGISGRTSSFMEKIVQHPFELPRVDFATRWKHVSAAITRAITDHAEWLDEQAVERYRLLVDSLSEGFTTPRQIARYEQHLRVLAKLIPGEVDLLDFAALAYLRLNHHDVYEVLPQWASDLRQGLVNGDEPGLGTDDWLERIKNVSRRDETTGAWAAISFLYPSVRGDSSATHPRAFSDPAYQERYYSLLVPENDVSDILVGRAIDSFVQRSEDPEAEQQLTAIIESVHTSLARLAITKLEAERRRTLSEREAVGKLVDFLHTQYARVESTSAEPDSYATSLLYWLAEEVLRGYTSDELDRTIILEKFGEDTALDIVSRAVSGWGSNNDPRRKRMLADFAKYAAESSTSRESLVLAEPNTLRTKIALRWRVDKAALAGAYDDLVDEDIGAFEALAIAAVRIATWWGGDTSRDEFEFDWDTWNLTVSANVRARMAQQLTTEFDAVEFDENDVSPERRRAFAIRAVRAPYPL